MKRAGVDNKIRAFHVGKDKDIMIDLKS